MIFLYETFPRMERVKLLLCYYTFSHFPKIARLSTIESGEKKLGKVKQNASPYREDEQGT